MSITIKSLMQQRRDTASNWSSENPTLLNGELGYETDTGKWKVGNGSAVWTSLAYTPWSQINAYPITTANIADNAITTVKIADDAVTAAKIANTSVTAGSYTTANITVDAQGRVTSAASGASAPPDGSVTTAKLADDAVTGAKLANDITIANNLTVTNDLTVNGTTTTIDSTTLVVEDKNIEIGKVSTPSDTTADGGGITLKGSSDKTLTWVDSTDCWTFNQALNLTAGTEGAPALVFNGDVNSGLFQPGADSLAIATGGTQRVTVASNGNVGIGTSSPSSPLTVEQSSGNVNFELHSTSSGRGTQIKTHNDHATFFHGLAGDTTGEYIYYTADAKDHVFSTNNSERLRIDSSGRLGLGTSSPSDQLHINEASSNSNNIKLTGTDVSSGLFIGYNGDAIAQFWHTANKDMRFATNNTERMRIDSSGNVGIGTTSPVNSTNYINLALSDSSGGIVTFMQGATQSADIIGGSGLYLRTLDASPITFRTNGSNERMRIDSSGRLLVGTTSSSQVNTAVFQGNSASGSGAGVIISSTLNNPSSTQVLGKLAFADNGHVDAASIRGRRDGGTWTSGSSQPTSLTFSTTADGASSPTERMRIDKNGTMFIRSESTAEALSVRTTQSNGNANLIAVWKSASSSITTGGTNVFAVRQNGDVKNTNNSYGALSDIKLKENIVDSGSQWDDIKDIRVRKYNFKESTNYETFTQLGVVAQEVEIVSPGLVSEAPDTDSKGSNLGTTTKSVNYSVLYMKAVKALQEAMERIETLEKRLSDAGIA